MKNYIKYVLYINVVKIMKKNTDGGNVIVYKDGDDMNNSQQQQEEHTETLPQQVEPDAKKASK
eukprot:UN01042